MPCPCRHLQVLAIRQVCERPADERALAHGRLMEPRGARFLGLDQKLSFTILPPVPTSHPACGLANATAQ